MEQTYFSKNNVTYVKELEHEPSWNGWYRAIVNQMLSNFSKSVPSFFIVSFTYILNIKTWSNHLW